VLFRSYTSRITRINLRVYDLAHGQYADADAQRLAARLSKHCDQLFTFLDRPEVPYDNNLAERMIRPAVILRKTCQGNRSEHGAAVQAVLMSVYRTLKLRGQDPIHTITSALTTYLTTRKLPPLPIQSIADG
jgi:transposase